MKIELIEIGFLFSQDILEKKIGLYGWISAKNSLMLVINSIFLGFSYILLNVINNGNSNNIALVSTLIGVSLLFISTTICLVTTLPIMKSSLWGQKNSELIVKNPRTVIGIKEFEIEEYLNLLKNISYNEMVKYNVDEIFKVNTNIYEDSQRIRASGGLTILGIVSLLFSLLFHFVSF